MHMRILFLYFQSDISANSMPGCKRNYASLSRNLIRTHMVALAHPGLFSRSIIIATATWWIYRRTVWPSNHNAHSQPSKRTVVFSRENGCTRYGRVSLSWMMAEIPDWFAILDLIKRFNCVRKVSCKSVGAHRSAHSRRTPASATPKIATDSMAANNVCGTWTPENTVHIGAVAISSQYVWTWTMGRSSITATELVWVRHFPMFSEDQDCRCFQPFLLHSTTVWRLILERHHFGIR